jgi:hypothetical protein
VGLSHKLEDEDVVQVGGCCSQAGPETTGRLLAADMRAVQCAVSAASCDTPPSACPCFRPCSLLLLQIVKKKVQIMEDARGRFCQQAKEYVRTVDRCVREIGWLWKRLGVWMRPGGCVQFAMCTYLVRLVCVRVSPVTCAPACLWLQGEEGRAQDLRAPPAWMFAYPVPCIVRFCFTSLAFCQSVLLFDLLSAISCENNILTNICTRRTGDITSGGRKE